ncbi:MAG: SMC-Scp complex subunit ScpB [Bacillota bacterium]
MQDKIKILESLIFLSGDQITKSEIMEGIEATPFELEEMIIALKEKYNGGIILKEYGDKLSFSTSAEVVDEIDRILNPIKQRKFSNSIMETLSIVAYKQPITRLELENVRGVSCDWAITQLLKDDIIEIVGRKDVIGRPQQFGTTSEFLKKFGLKTLAELPDYNAIKAKIDADKEESTNKNTFFLSDDQTEIGE